MNEQLMREIAREVFLEMTAAELNIGGNSVQEVITNHLTELGIKSGLRGYRYIREAVGLIVKDESILNNITKVLYPTIAEKFGTTPSRTERAIRHAVDTAWDSGNLPLMKLFRGYANGKKPKPTNTDFLAAVAERIRLSQIGG